MNRRSLLLGAAAALAMPAVIRTEGLLMPVRALITEPPLMDLMEASLGNTTRYWLEYVQAVSDMMRPRRSLFEYVNFDEVNAVLADLPYIEAPTA